MSLFPHLCDSHSLSTTHTHTHTLSAESKGEDINPSEVQLKKTKKEEKKTQQFSQHTHKEGPTPSTQKIRMTPPSPISSNSSCSAIPPDPTIPKPEQRTGFCLPSLPVPHSHSWYGPCPPEPPLTTHIFPGLLLFMSQVRWVLNLLVSGPIQTIQLLPNQVSKACSLPSLEL